MSVYIWCSPTSNDCDILIRRNKTTDKIYNGKYSCVIVYYNCSSWNAKQTLRNCCDFNTERKVFVPSTYIKNIYNKTILNFIN